MASKKLLLQRLTTASAKMMHELGEEVIQPGTTLTPESRYRYVEYDDGTGNLTANTYQILVPLSGNRLKYTADKTMLRNLAEGAYAAVCLADVTTTSNKYIWVQTAGYSHLRAAGAAISAGDPIMASPGGTDKVGEVAFATALTATTTTQRQALAVYATARSAAVAATSQLLLDLGVS